MSNLTEEYWSNRYLNDQTGWDVGSVSTPLKEYFDQLTDKNLRILIPGCGNGHEAEYLWSKGFTHVFVVDISKIPLKQLAARNSGLATQYFLHADFFDLSMTFDLIVEQTFFCAISPNLRLSYAKKASSLLRDGGKLIGVLFNREFEGGPPFGGNRDEYITYFKGQFSSIYMGDCINSIKPRQEAELFMICKK
jgi:SAM-dependent methyltransferase